MSFTRRYANNAQGDPFRFRIPKKLKKLKVGRAIGKLARFAAPFIPGGGLALSAADAFMPSSRGRAQAPDPPQELEVAPAMAFSRMYGYSPDWSGDPKPLPSKRKSAGAGPKAKADRKQNVRDQRQVRAASPTKQRPGRGPSVANRKRNPSAKDIGNIFAKNAGSAFRGLGSIAQQFAQGGVKNPWEAKAAFDAGAGPTFKQQMKEAGGMGGGGRQKMNVANVKALKRSIRRFDGFKKLVKQVDKLLPPGARLSAHHATASRARLKGHKAGCGCVSCR